MHFTHYPAWPPHAIVDLVHWYGNKWDPVLMNRPAFYRATIWIDVLAFGPFYAFAIYAFIRGRNWIRVPALVWSGVMMANVTMILFEERYGEFATSHFGMVLAANAAWFLFPLLVIAANAARPPVHRAPVGSRRCHGPRGTAGTSLVTDRYGPWAVVAGASEGIGAAFAVRLAPPRPECRTRRARRAPAARTRRAR